VVVEVVMVGSEEIAKGVTKFKVENQTLTMVRKKNGWQH
jgi:hypothetical protein